MGSLARRGVRRQPSVPLPAVLSARCGGRFGSTGLLNQHCDRIRSAQLAQTINVLQAIDLTDGAMMVLTPTYHVFDMYRGHQHATLLPLAIDAEQCTCEDISIPATSASAS